MDIHVQRLRKKLGIGSELVTVFGVGTNMSRAKNNKQKNGKKGRKLRLLGGIRLRLALEACRACAAERCGALCSVCQSGGTQHGIAHHAGLLTLQTNTQVYVRQYLLLSERDADEESFRQCAQEIADELYSTGGTNLSLYSLSGKKLLGRGGEHSNVIVTGGSAAASEQSSCARRRKTPLSRRKTERRPTGCIMARDAAARCCSPCRSPSAVKISA